MADEHHLHYEKRHKKGDILNLFFDEYVEEHLVQPTFLTGPSGGDFPAGQAYAGRIPITPSALSCLCWARELANAFQRAERSH